jgi:hypothetical protein
MKPIQKDEIFQNLKSFLKTKGIELEEGSYTHRVHQGCGILAETVNLSQEAFHRAKTEVGKGLDKMRRVIHEKTAPKPPIQPSQAASNPAEPPPKAAPGMKKAPTKGRKTAGPSRKK